VLYVAGTKWTHFLVLGALATGAIAIVLVGAPAVGVEVLKPYQVDRLTAFVNPTDDPRSQGYQLKQSIVGIGSGGKTGRGAEGATQTKLNFIPEHHTDFIFAVVGEELGLFGGLAVIALFGLLLWRGMRAALRAPDRFGMLLGVGIVTGIVAQALFNMSVVLALVPTKGIPLPFISYGGSSLVPTLFAVGVLLNISQHADAPREFGFSLFDLQSRAAAAAAAGPNQKPKIKSQKFA
jgi:cell division protein FtsW (lipid II flippase)